ncbi:serine/threonine-protein kinase par-1-like [Pectinophora gossypiella]|uniref:serine/threonine-protein kinase par-1-like n=1 Tax=Pectinophora gossypiella TaxID=13191 RepID=UPI00214E3C12|nr:serine/threonine-protein kinase par-1-like [Pectinophora gossypiella]
MNVCVRYIINLQVAIKIIDLTCIKEEYARRNLHREPRVMARLRHPCIAALYETMMHGPRLYVVMEAAGGGDLCAHVLAARGPARGLPEARARALAAQLVSAVRHMHARGVVHRDLKMENIMLDSTKQFIKIVDFGLSNLWSAGGALRTPCGSLEYAAPELFVDGRRYGPEVDLWSIGVIVYGMVTGGLPFTGAEGAAGGAGRSRPQLRAAIARGFTRKQRAALACVSNECKTFVQQLLEPNVELRMKIEEAARHRWIKRPGMRMKAHPFGAVDPKANREIYKQISEVCSQTVIDVIAQVKAEPFGPLGGIYNIKTHLQQIQGVPGVDLLWSSNPQEPRPASPPEYRAIYEPRPDTAPSSSKALTPPPNSITHTMPRKVFTASTRQNGIVAKDALNGPMIGSTNGPMANVHKLPPTRLINNSCQVTKDMLNAPQPKPTMPVKPIQTDQKTFRHEVLKTRSQPLQSPRFTMMNRPYTGVYGLKKPTYKVYDSGDCGLDPRLPSIDEHSNTDLNDKNKKARTPFVRKVNLEEERRLSSCPNRMGDGKRPDFYRRAGDALPNWRTGMSVNTPSARILLQSNATTIKRASLGNIVSPHSSSNSHCKSERAMPVAWFSRGAAAGKDPSPLQRLRRTAPMK